MKKLLKPALIIGVFTLITFSVYSVVINEVLYDPVSGAQFIELYNLTGSDIPLDDWEIQASGSYFSTVVTIPAGKTIPANQYFLISSGTMLPTPDVTDSGLVLDTMTDTVAGVRLRDNSQAVIDTVLYADDGVTNPDLLEDDTEATDSARAALSVTTQGNSLTRDALHTDSDNSRVDFVEVTPSPVNSLGDTIPTATTVASYGFDADEEGWTSGGADPPYTMALFFYTTGNLIIQSVDASTYGYWEGPVDDIPYVEDSIYRATFSVRGTAQQDLAPKLRARINTQSATITGLVTVESRLGGEESPSGTARDYTVYFDPMDQSGYQGNELTDDLFVGFDLLSFDPTDDVSGAFLIDSVIVERFDKSAIITDTIARVYDTTSEFDTWTTGGAAIVFTLPLYGVGDGSLILTANNNDTDTYGFWETSRTANEVDIQANMLYRVLFTISSASAQEISPQMRLRIGTESNKMAYVYSVFSNLDGVNSPSSAGTEYQLLLYPPQSDVGADPLVNGLIFAVDMLNFTPGDDANGDLTIERVEVQTIDPNILP